MQDLIVIIVIACCAGWLGRRLWKQFRAAGKNGAAPSCGCNCSGCDTGTADKVSSCSADKDKEENS